MTEDRGDGEVAHDQREDEECAAEDRGQHDGHHHLQPRDCRRGAKALRRLLQLYVEGADCRQRADIDVGVVDEGHHGDEAEPAVEAWQPDAPARERSASERPLFPSIISQVCAAITSGTISVVSGRTAISALAGVGEARGEIGEWHADQAARQRDGEAEQDRVHDGPQVFRFADQNLPTRQAVGRARPKLEASRLTSG